jgi:hypothetical protein
MLLSIRIFDGKSNPMIRSLIFCAVFLFTPFAEGNFKCIVNDFSNLDKLSMLFLDAFMKVESCKKEELIERFNGLLSLKYCEWLSFYEGEELVGFGILDLRNYPDFIHIRQACVKINKQQERISRECFIHILERYKKCNTFHILARKTNTPSQKMVLTIGFFPSAFIEEGYDPTIFMGFTFVKKSP